MCFVTNHFNCLNSGTEYLRSQYISYFIQSVSITHMKITYFTYIIILSLYKSWALCKPHVLSADGLVIQMKQSNFAILSFSINNIHFHTRLRLTDLSNENGMFSWNRISNDAFTCTHTTVFRMRYDTKYVTVLSQPVSLIMLGALLLG
jgi:hypothetical protein